MVTRTWLISLAVQIWSYIYTEAATCLTQFDLHMCPQYDHGTPLTTDNTQSAMACAALCSSDLECRSFQYNPSNNECWTNAERLAMRNTTCSTRIRYGEFQTATCRGSRLFDPCFQNDDCIDANSSCLNGRCECSYGHPYDYHTNSCPADCENYGNTLHEVYYYLRLQNNYAVLDIGMEECQARCFSATTFICRFIEFTDFKHSTECYLSEVNALSAAPNTVVNEESPEDRQWDRNCA